MSRPYECHIQPYSGNQYGEEIDVTDYILHNGFKAIEQTIDNSDYIIGAFSYSDLTLKVSNHTGIFSYPSTGNSIFNYTRDKAIVIIRFNGDVVFKGLINEEASRANTNKATIKFEVLSEDSILRKTFISAGTIREGATFSDAIMAIFGIQNISNLLDLDDLSVVVNEVIDEPGKLENRSCKDSLNDLLNVCGSIMSVDNSRVTIGPRSVNKDSRQILYSDSDALRRRPTIFNIKDYNSGMHRLFNSVSINGHRVIDEGSIAVYGLREREDFEYPFLTAIEKIDRVAKNILNEFRYPQEELKALLLTEQIRKLKLSDNVALDYRPLSRPAKGKRLPLYGSAKYGEAIYPYVNSGPSFAPNTLWSVYGKKERPQDYLTELHLRLVGRDFGDAYFLPNIYGQAVYGTSTYG